jgi:hypothetical protein
MDLFPQLIKLHHKDTHPGQARARRETVFADKWPQRRSANFEAAD